MLASPTILCCWSGDQIIKFLDPILVSVTKRSKIVRIGTLESSELHSSVAKIFHFGTLYSVPEILHRVELSLAFSNLFFG